MARTTVLVGKIGPAFAAPGSDGAGTIVSHGSVTQGYAQHSARPIVLATIFNAMASNMAEAHCNGIPTPVPTH